MILNLFFLVLNSSILEKYIFNGDIEKARELMSKTTSPEDLVYIYFLKNISEDENEQKDAIFYLMASEGTSPFFQHIYAHKSFFTFGLSASIQEISTIYFQISERITSKYLENRYFLTDKEKFNNLIKKIPVNYLMKLLISGDKRAEDTYINMVLGGHIDPSSQIENLKLLAKLSNPRAMTVLGTLYLEGHGVQQDVTTAMHFFRQAIALGDYMAYNGLGKIFMHEEHREVTLAKKYFEDAAAHGSAEAEYQLFKFYRTVYKIEDLGLSHLMRAVKRSYMPAMFAYAQRLHRNGDIASAISHLVPIADFDYPIVILQKLAQKDYENGHFTPCLYKLLFLGETGSLNSISNLIYLLQTKKKLISNQNRVLFKFYDKLSKMGQITHLVDLADAYFYGYGTIQSYKKAFAFYYASMIYKQARGIFSLSYMYEHGLGTEKSLLQAFRMLFLTLSVDPMTYLIVWYTIFRIFIYIILQSLFMYKYVIFSAFALFLGYFLIIRKNILNKKFF